MTNLTAHQSDLLLDVYEACRNVADLYRLKVEAETDGTDDDVREVTKLYDDAVEGYGDIFAEAMAYLPDDLLEKVVVDNLPEHLILEGVSK